MACDCSCVRYNFAFAFIKHASQVVPEEVQGPQTQVVPITASVEDEGPTLRSYGT